MNDTLISRKKIQNPTKLSVSNANGLSFLPKNGIMQSILGITISVILQCS